MTIPLLATKLYIPPIHADFVPRPDLIERLNVGLSRKLSLVCAPAGFGKTSLISVWLQQLDRPVGWLSLEPGDNDLARFMTYFISALQEIDKTIGIELLAATGAAQLPPVELLLTMMINEITAVDSSFVLVLDDYHVIEAQPIHEALAFLLDHLPPQMHLVITSRSDPFLPISRLRAKGQVSELRADHLRFSTEEAATFLNQVMGLDLSDDEIRSLENHTEGWIAGLHLAALSMQDHTHKGEDFASFIAAFTGDDRYVVDYLVDEVLAQRPKGTREFLLQTSILNRMTGQLCDAVTGKTGGKRMLEGLEHANMFIVPLDNQRHWYRYHHLFARLLRKRLEESTTSEEMETLHERASQWYEKKEMPVEAIEHAFNSNDNDDAIRLIILSTGMLFERGQLAILTKWWARIPLENLISHPGLCLSFTWAWLATGHPDEAEQCLQTTEQALGIKMEALFNESASMQKWSPKEKTGLAEIAVIRAQLAIGRGDVAESLRLASLVLPHLSDDDQPGLNNPPISLRNVAVYTMGVSYQLKGELEKAGKYLLDAANLASELKNVHLVATAFGHLANVQTCQGYIRQAMDTCIRGMELVEDITGQRSPISAILLAELGNILYQQNDLDSALINLEEAIALAKPWGYLDAFLPGYTGLARVKAVQGDWQAVISTLDEFFALGKSYPHIMPAMETKRALLWIHHGDVESAYCWTQDAGFDTDGEIDFLRFDGFLVLARVLLAQNEYRQCIELLTRMLKMAEKAGWMDKVIEMLVLKALALAGLGEPRKAMTVLERALTMAEPQGHVRVFIDEGEAMIDLIRQAGAKGISREYAAALLREIEPVRSQKEGKPVSTLFETLSEREQEVLRLLKSELTGPEIADDLMIALSTFRYHTKNIYRKLNVGNRRAAIQKAEDLKII